MSPKLLDAIDNERYGKPSSKNRINSYFMPSILSINAIRVLKYLDKYGFNNIILIIYIMDVRSSLDDVVSLEQYFMDKLKSNLNVDMVASSLGYYEPMYKSVRERFGNSHPRMNSRNRPRPGVPQAHTRMRYVNVE